MTLSGKKKFIAALVGFLFAATAALGFEVPVEQVALTESIIVLYLVIEFILDAIRSKK